MSAKERNIRLYAHEVRAVLGGRQTQVRRVAKEFDPEPGKMDAILRRYPNQNGCPYGQPGDRLWVRETWADVNSESGPGIAYKADGEFWQPDFDGEDFGAGPSFNYEKYPGTYANWYSDLIHGLEGRWKPSIHMPRWASRIDLEVTSVRVERLQDISEADCAKEGAPFTYSGFAPEDAPDWRGWYRALWESINGDRSWDANPFVWVIEFKRIKP